MDRKKIITRPSFTLRVFNIIYCIVLSLNMSEEKDANDINQECPIQTQKNMIESFNAMIGFISIPHPTICDNLYNGFLLPIEYLEKSQQQYIAKNVSDDLELIVPVDISGSSQKTPMYELFADTTNEFGKMLIPEVAKRYTTNIGFIEDTQKVIERLDVSQYKLNNQQTERFVEVWKEIKEDKSFLEKHSYMEFVMLEELNKSRTFLNTYSVLNLISPIYSLALPLILFLMPFILLKIWNIPITFEMYLNTLRDISKTHFIGRLLNIRSWSFENVLYGILIGGMYVMQTYSQVTSCIRYHKAVKRMNDNLLFMREYLETVISSMNSFIKTIHDLPYYSDFCQDVHSNKLVLQNMYEKIGDRLTTYGWTMKKVGELGHMFDCYYQIYSCVDCESSLRYSVGFEGYIDIVKGISLGYKNGILGKAMFQPLQIFESEDSDEQQTSKNIFVSQYYPPHKNTDNCVQNTVNLDTNMIITGVNASGKTTTLKTTALNIIFTQQFGFGFYQCAFLTPYTHIHSYLNIPDTSGRDSLFQAESRRCKEILDKIRDTPDTERHFCIFDELYSGTNPKEAAKSAHSLLKFLSQKPNVKFVLTTHYVNVCRKFRKSKLVKNYKMVVDTDANNHFVYTYKMTKGISILEGGIAILKTMDYPAEIINTIERGNLVTTKCPSPKVRQNLTLNPPLLESVP